MRTTVYGGALGAALVSSGIGFLVGQWYVRPATVAGNDAPRVAVFNQARADGYEPLYLRPFSNCYEVTTRHDGDVKLVYYSRKSARFRGEFNSPTGLVATPTRNLTAASVCSD